MTTVQQAARFKLSEDWVSTLIGLGIVAVVALGLLGPGPQSVTLSAAPGETVSASAVPASGWTVSATLADESTAVDGSVTALQGGQRVIYTCDGDAVTASSAAQGVPEDLAAPEGNAAQLVLVNRCTSEVSLTYQHAAAIPWPLFRLFSR